MWLRKHWLWNASLDTPCTIIAMSGKEELNKDPSSEKESAEEIDKSDKHVTRADGTLRSNTIDSAVVRSFFHTDGVQENEVSGSTCRTCLKPGRVLEWAERIFLIFICCAVAMAFTVPIIIYAVDTDRGSDGGNNTITSINLDLDDCLDEVCE